MAFIRYIGKCGINSHYVGLYKTKGGAQFRHERNNRQSNINMNFASIDDAEAYLDAIPEDGARLLNVVLGRLGIAGFPCE